MRLYVSRILAPQSISSALICFLLLLIHSPKIKEFFLALQKNFSPRPEEQAKAELKNRQFVKKPQGIRTKIRESLAHKPWLCYLCNKQPF